MNIRNNVLGIPVTLIQLEVSLYYITDRIKYHPIGTDFTRKGVLNEPLTRRFVDRFFSVIDGDMIHAGAFYGDMLYSFSQKVDKLFTFEPTLENYAVACAVVEDNNLDNVYLFHCSLGRHPFQKALLETGCDGSDMTSERGDVKYDGDTYAGFNHIVLVDGESFDNKIRDYEPHNYGNKPVRESVVVMTIDQFNFDNVKLIHLDVEGFEAEAIAGAHNTITRLKPSIMLENHVPYPELAQYLTQQGYKLFERLNKIDAWCTKEQSDILI